MTPPLNFSADLAAYFDLQYNARVSVNDFDRYPRQYRALSDQAHASLRCFNDVAYGTGAGERLDIFPGNRPDSPVLLFIHGGYWRALSKADSAFMAPALTAAGACVVVLEYDLAPVVTLDHIVDQSRRALAWIYRHIREYGGDPQHLYASGSSAGGHLVGMLLAGGWQADYGVPEKGRHHSFADRRRSIRWSPVCRLLARSLHGYRVGGNYRRRYFSNSAGRTSANVQLFFSAGSTRQTGD